MKRLWKRAAALVLAALMLCGGVLLTSCEKDLTGATPEELRGYMALESKHFQVTGTMFVFYLYETGSTVLNGLTEEKLAEMGYSEGMSLKEIRDEMGVSLFEKMRDYTAEDVERLLTWCEGAYEAGLSLESADYQSVENYLTNLRIESLYYADGDSAAYIASLYGGYVTEADIANALQLEILASKYATYLGEQIPPKMTEERLNEIIASKYSTADRDETITRKIVHLYLPFDRFDGEENAKKIAEQILREFDAAEDGIAYLESAKEKYSSDSNFYYDNVSKGDMLSVIDEWLYTDGRAVGDIGMMTSANGYHIVYYAEESDPKYVADAKLDLQDAIREEFLAAVRKKAKIKLHKNVMNAIEI